MAASPTTKQKQKNSGLTYWMSEVVKETARASEAFAPDPVHDLRVSLRRCRSMAEVVQSFDSDPAWRKLRKAGKQVFKSLGDLRDCQVLIEWAGRLSYEDDLVRVRLLEYLAQEEQRLKESAAQSMSEFDIDQWQKWSKYLSSRIAHYPEDGELFQGLALARWHDARELHQTAARTRSKKALHQLRIGIKKFRYVVENFLPTTHKQIGKGLKEVQDLLGEVHDLDVLWETALRVHAFAGQEERTRWAEIVQRERKQRVDRYKELAQNRHGIWQEWRGMLPSEVMAERASQKRIQVWASLLDPNPAHSRRVTAIALKVYDSLVRDGLFRAEEESTRKILAAAATMHDVGKSGGDKGHHKRSFKLICEFEKPYGWQDEDLRVAALAARYHRGALPSLRHLDFRELSPAARAKTKQISAVLRFANALDHAQRGIRSRLTIRREQAYVLFKSGSLTEGSREAERLAGARYPLEILCRMPIAVRRDRTSAQARATTRSPESRTRHQ